MRTGRLGKDSKKTARSEARFGAVRVTVDPEERMRVRFRMCVLQPRGDHDKNDAFKLMNLALQCSIDQGGEGIQRVGKLLQQSRQGCACPKIQMRLCSASAHFPSSYCTVSSTTQAFPTQLCK